MLASMLKKYPSFLGISQTLPVTAYITMIDLWMISAMMFPFAEVALVALKASLQQRRTESNNGRYTI